MTDEKQELTPAQRHAGELRACLDRAVWLAERLGWRETLARAVNTRARAEIDEAHAAGRGDWTDVT